MKAKQIPPYPISGSAFLYFIRAPHFVQVSQTLPVQLTRSRHPHVTQKVSLSAAAFLP